MKQSRKTLLGLLAAFLVLGLLIVGAVSAQTPAPQPGPQFQDKDGDGVCDVCGGQPGQGFRGGMMGRGWGMGGMWNSQSLIGTVAEALNMEAADVLAELDADTTLRQVIVNHGGNPETIVNTFLAARREALSQLVEAGRLTQGQADAMIAHMQEEVTERLDETGAGFGCGMMGGGRGGMMRGWGRGGNNGANPTLRGTRWGMTRGA